MSPGSEVAAGEQVRRGHRAVPQRQLRIAVAWLALARQPPFAWKDA
jgi:hypothetical protein